MRGYSSNQYYQRFESLKRFLFILKNCCKPKCFQYKYSKIYFGTKRLPNTIDINDFIAASNISQYGKILNVPILLDIALFDIWIENDDRKPSNPNLLLFPNKKGFEIIPIDNALTFATLDINELNPAYVGFSDNDSILYSPLGKSVVKNTGIHADWLEKARERFYICIGKACRDFQLICDSLPREFQLSSLEQQSLYNFIFNEKRNKGL